MVFWLPRRRPLPDGRSLEHVTRFFVLLVCASVLGVTGWRAYLARDLVLRDSQVDTANIARSVADHAHATMRMADILVAGLVERVEGDGTGPTALARLHDVMVAKVAAVPRVSTLLVFDPDGEVLASSLPRLTASAGHREYFAHHRADPDRGTHVALSVQSHGSDRWTLCVSRRFDQPDGTFGGVVLATVDIETFSAFYASFSIGAHGSIALVGEDGALFARVPVRQDSIGQSFATAPFFRGYRQQGPVGNSQGVSPTDGVMRLNSFRKVDSYPLVVGVALSQADILASWKADAWTALAASGAIALVLAWLGWHLAGQIRLRHRSEAVMRDSERQYRLLADTSTDLIIQLGPDLRRVYVSPASRALLGYEPREMVGQHPRDLPHPDDWPMVEAALASIAANGHAPPYAFRARHKDGSNVWVEAHGRKLLDEEGIVLSMRDVTRRKAAEEQLEALNRMLSGHATTDALTGLANRRRFDEALDAEWRRAARDGAPLSLLLLDVDRFKLFNDRYGHQGGDGCLKGVATAVANLVRRPGDLAARYGGEEMAVLLPGTDAEGAADVAEQIRAAIEALAVEHLGNLPAQVVTASFGVATAQVQAHGGPCSAEELIATADAALYEAKRTGRNRVMSASSLPTNPTPSAHPQEEQRLATLARYEAAGAAGPSRSLDSVVRLTASLFKVPIALVTMVGKDSQTFVAKVGLKEEGTSRDVSFCNHTIAGDEVFTVADASKDPRFSDNPLVQGDPGIRFYAGAPLVTSLGQPLGALCIIDRVARPPLTSAERVLLTDFAALAASYMDQRLMEAEAGKPGV